MDDTPKLALWRRLAPWATAALLLGWLLWRLDLRVFVAQLAAIKAPENREKWVKWLKGWQTRLSKSEQPAEKPKTPDT